MVVSDYRLSVEVDNVGPSRRDSFSSLSFCSRRCVLTFFSVESDSLLNLSCIFFYSDNKAVRSFFPNIGSVCVYLTLDNVACPKWRALSFSLSPRTDGSVVKMAVALPHPRRQPLRRAGLPAKHDQIR